MDSFNNFFKKIYSNPALLWRGGAGLLFLSLGFAMLFMPNLIGLDTSPRIAFAVLLVLYGAFRLGGFYTSYKNIDNE